MMRDPAEAQASPLRRSVIGGELWLSHDALAPRDWLETLPEWDGKSHKPRKTRYGYG